MSMVVFLTLGISCRHSLDDSSGTDPDKEAAATDTAAAATPPPAPVAPTPYEGTVTDKVTEGSVQFDTISTQFPCNTHSDCTSTTFENIPKSSDDCTCKAGCTPYVVNKTEMEKREAANKKYCTNRNWFGPHCPAPPCSFSEFDKFKCVDNLCQGLAMGKN